MRLVFKYLKIPVKMRPKLRDVTIIDGDDGVVIVCQVKWPKRYVYAITHCGGTRSWEPGVQYAEVVALDENGQEKSDLLGELGFAFNKKEQELVDDSPISLITTNKETDYVAFLRYRV